MIAGDLLGPLGARSATVALSPTQRSLTRSLSPSSTGKCCGVPTLWNEGFVSRVVAGDKLKRCLFVGASGVFLLLLAFFMVLTNTTTLLITLAVLAAIIFGSSRLVMAGTAESNKRSGRN